MRALVAALCFAIAGPSCVLLGGSNQRRTSAESQEGDESGVKRINKTLRQFREALKKKDFDYATKYLRSALNQAKKASDITRGHPEFEDLELLIEQSRQRLDRAIEQDRIERRNAVITELITRGDEVMARANRLYANLSQRVPTQDDVDQLDDILGLLVDLEADGLVYLDDRRYAAHAQQRDSGIPTIRKLRDDSIALMGAAKEIEIHVHTAFSAATQGNRTAELEEKAELFQKAAAAFEQCARGFETLQSQNTYYGQRSINTRLGNLSMKDTHKKCTSAAKTARHQVAKAQWYQSASASVAELESALSALRGSADATAELEHARNAIAALGVCATSMAKTSKHLGYDGKYSFTTALGSYPGKRLAKVCTKEQRRLSKALPQIEWRTTLASLEAIAARAVELRKNAQTKSSGAERAAELELAVSGLNRCTSEAKRLAKSRGADRKHLLSTPFGKLTVTALGKTCAEQKASFAAELAEAVKQREAEGFAKDTKGDERDVIAREGVPTRIETFAGGRIFVYEELGQRGAKEAKRIGFDAQGARVDYTTRWRTQLDAPLKDVDLRLGALKDAQTAAERVTALQAAQQALDACVEMVRGSNEHPGYDAKAVFTTALGKLTPERLAKACERRKAALEKRAPALVWRASFEALRDNINRLRQRTRSLENIKDPTERIAEITHIAQDLQSCLEGVTALESQPNAEKDYELESAFGVITLGGATSACELMFDQVVEAGEKAAMDREIAEFVKGCKGDEIAVAWREGIPSKIVTFGDKRAFVYEKERTRFKTVSKRYAFDADGKRISETALLADLSIEPDLEELPMPELVAPVRRKPRKP